MKKSFIYYIAIVLGTSSCAKMLNVEPDTQIAPEQITKNNLPLVLNGARLGLTQNAFYQYYCLQDVMGDDVETLSFTGFEAGNVVATENVLQFLYRYPYQCIGNANAVINFGEGDATLNPVVGEAYLLRAYAYMLLSEHFGAVAIMKGGEDPLSLPLREPVEKVQAFIEADLKKGIEYLPDYGTSAAVGSKQAAQLLLARLYLNTNKATEAGVLAEEVIRSGKFALQSTNYGDIFKFKSPAKESVFVINETSSSTVLGLPAVYGAGGTGVAGSGNTWIDSNLVKSYENTDIRKAFFLKKKATSLTIEVYFLTKYPQELTPAYQICRVSEAYLISAEAAARKGVVDVTRYNELRSKRGASTKTNGDFASPQAFLDEIEQERRREFVGERLRWNDMRRFGKAVPFLASLRQPKGHVLLPVPDRLLTLNPAVKQNEDY